jgi:hypothetical protein
MDKFVWQSPFHVSTLLRLKAKLKIFRAHDNRFEKHRACR